MGRIGQHHLDRLAQVLEATEGEPLSLALLARRLHTTFPTARRRLEAYARTKGLELVPGGSLRVGKRGPQSVTWLLRPAGTTTPALVAQAEKEKAPPPPSPPPRVKQAVPRPSLPPLSLPAAVLAALSGPEQRALQLLLRTGTVRTSELAVDLGLSEALVDGLMRKVRRTLDTHGLPHFTDEELPSGETLFRAAKEARR